MSNLMTWSLDSYIRAAVVVVAIPIQRINGPTGIHLLMLDSRGSPSRVLYCQSEAIMPSLSNMPCALNTPKATMPEVRELFWIGAGGSSAITSKTESQISSVRHNHFLKGPV